MLQSFGRKLRTFVIILIFSIGIVSFAPIAQALDGAKWVDDSKSAIIFDGATFNKANSGEVSKLPENLRNGNVFIEKTNADQNTARVINIENLDNKIEGKISTIKVSALGNATQEGETQDISGEGVLSNTESKTSCAIVGGMGWAVCGIGNTLAFAIDYLYSAVENFLKTQPLEISNRNGVYRVWSYMRNTANVLFAIALAFVIYSQVSNIGISNYGIKKMLPKLFVAAILINLSFYICAIAVDLSNILGSQTQNLLVNIRKEIFFSGGETVQMSDLTWEQMISSILAGGTGIVLGGIAFVANGGWQGLAITALLVAVGVIYSAFVAFMVLAARQAIITILIFLSPLAFAAKVLPNTEKWYNKWKDLLTTMLVMYPLIALLFGGSQLAGTTIMTNSGGNLGIFLLGMAVQVIPLAITPTIMRLSGGLLGRFANMVNNPDKGPIDATKKFLREGRDGVVANKIAKGGNLTARWKDLGHRRSRRLASGKNLADKYQQARFEQRELEDFESAKAMSEGRAKQKALSKNTIFNETVGQQFFDASSANKSAKVSELRADMIKGSLKIDEVTKLPIGIDENGIKELQKKYGSAVTDFVSNANYANAYREAEKNNNLAYNSALSDHFRSEAGQRYLKPIAGGIRGAAGENSSLARAMEASSKEKKEEVAALTSLMKSAKFEAKEFKDIFDKSIGESVSKNGISLTIDDALRAAAAEDHIGRNGINLDTLADLVDRTHNGDLKNISGAISDAIKTTKKDDLQYAGQGLFNDIAAGSMSGADFKNKITNKFVTENSDEKNVKMNLDMVENMFSITHINHLKATDKAGYESVVNSLKNISNDKDLYSKVSADKGKVMREAITHLQNTYGETGFNINNIKSKK